MIELTLLLGGRVLVNKKKISCIFTDTESSGTEVHLDYKDGYVVVKESYDEIKKML
jgi:uncharacterized protein YlzI (FlbEa/FlbD family)